MILGVINVRSKGGGVSFSGEGVLYAGFIALIIGWLYLFVFFILPVCLSACLPVYMITAIGCKEVGIQIAQQNILSHYRSPII